MELLATHVAFVGGGAVDRVEMCGQTLAGLGMCGRCGIGGGGVLAAGLALNHTHEGLRALTPVLV